MVKSPLSNRRLDDTVIFTAGVILMLVFAVFIFVQSYTYNEQARRAPQLIGGITIVLIALRLYTIRTGEYKQGNDEDTPTGVESETPADTLAADIEEAASAQSEEGSTLVVSLWILAFGLAAYAIGFIVTIPAFILLFLVQYGGYSVLRALIIAVGSTVLIYYFFGVFIGLRGLWEGALFAF